MNTQAVPYEELQGARAIESAMANTEEAKAVKEVEARVILAKRFPRDEALSRNKILAAFENTKLAESAMYSYPRGGQTISDLSIRAAETIGNYWGNITYGICEVNRGAGQSEMLAYCWDLETNVYHERKFTVKHWRDKRSGGVAVTEERDIYEVTFNAGARRLRSCILECIPAHIKDEAEHAVNQTLKRAGEGIPIEDRVKKMIGAFVPLNITEDMIEEMLAHKSSVISEQELIKLRQIYRAIIEGQGQVEDYFKPPKKDAKSENPVVVKKAAKKKTSKKTSKKTASKEKEVLPPEETTADPGMNYSDIFKALTMEETKDGLNDLKDAARELPEKQRESLIIAIDQKIESLDGKDSDDSMGLE